MYAIRSYYAPGFAVGGDYVEELRSLKNYKPSRFKAPGCIYKSRFADSAVFFVNQLRHTKGKWHGMPFELIGFV